MALTGPGFCPDNFRQKCFRSLVSMILLFRILLFRILLFRILIGRFEVDQLIRSKRLDHKGGVSCCNKLNFWKSTA